jgi:hypothetical protein
MEHVPTPEVIMLHTTENGIRLIIRSWPYPARNRRGRVTGHLFDSIYTIIKIDVHRGADEWLNPVLLDNITDLEDPVDGLTYAAETNANLAKVLQSMSCQADLKALQSRIRETRNGVIAMGAR